MRRRSAFRGGALPKAAGCLAATLVLCGGEHAAMAAETHYLVDLELYTLRGTVDGKVRESIFTLGVTAGLRSGSFVAYAGGGLGFFTLHGRLGVAFLPGNMYDSGLMAHFEVRPGIVRFKCSELGVLGNLGVGYRFALEYRRPDEAPGPGLYVLPAFEGGPAWLSACSNSDDRHRAKLLLGGTAALGLDW